jgi:chromosome segregation ATPase
MGWAFGTPMRSFGRSPMMRLLIFLLPGLLASCAPVNRAELAKRALAADPEFVAVLDKRATLESRITTEHKKLALVRETIQQDITQKKKELAEKSSAVRRKITEIKAQMDPDVRRYTTTLGSASEDLRAKQAQRAAIGREIAQLKKALKAAGAAGGASQRAQQETQITERLRDAQRIDQEIAALKEYLKLLKTKLLLIRF